MKMLLTLTLLLLYSCVSKKDVDASVNKLSKQRDQLVSFIGSELDANYLSSIESYSRTFIQFNHLLKDVNKRRLKKIKQQEVDEICAAVLLDARERKILRDNCTHPYFKFCPETVYQMEEILAALVKNVSRVHHIRSYPLCKSKLED